MDGSFTDQTVHGWLQDIADGSYCSLHYDTPALADAAYSETFGGGYARQPIVWAQPSNRAIWSLEAIRFTGLAQGQITHFGIWDSLTNGELKAYAQLPNRVLLLAGQGYVLGAGDLAISLG